MTSTHQRAPGNRGRARNCNSYRRASRASEKRGTRIADDPEHDICGSGSASTGSAAGVTPRSIAFVAAAGARRQDSEPRVEAARAADRPGRGPLPD